MNLKRLFLLLVAVLLVAGCAAPVGALATIVGEQILLTAAAWDTSGTATVTGSGTGTVGDADEIGTRLADQLLARGADRLVGGPVR